MRFCDAWRAPCAIASSLTGAGWLAPMEIVMMSTPSAIASSNAPNMPAESHPWSSQTFYAAILAEGTTPLAVPICNIVGTTICLVVSCCCRGSVSSMIVSISSRDIGGIDASSYQFTAMQAIVLSSNVHHSFSDMITEQFILVASEVFSTSTFPFFWRRNKTFIIETLRLRPNSSVNNTNDYVTLNSGVAVNILSKSQDLVVWG